MVQDNFVSDPLLQAIQSCRNTETAQSAFLAISQTYCGCWTSPGLLFVNSNAEASIPPHWKGPVEGIQASD